MGPASDRRGDQTEQPLLSVVSLEVRWLQNKFGELLEQQQNVLTTLSGVLTRVDVLEGQVATLERRLRAEEARHDTY